MRSRLMRFVATFTLTVLVSAFVSGQSLYWNKLLQEQNTSGFSVPARSHVAANGNITTAGMFSVPVDFDPDGSVANVLSPKSGSSQNLYFARYDNNGALTWVKHLEGDDWMSLSGMDLDASGNVLVTGLFNDQIDLNPAATQALYSPPNTSAEDFFISKYNSSGNFIWARHIISTVHAWSEDLDQDNSGNIYIAGVTRGTTDFDPGGATQNVTSPNDYLFIAKYNSSGNFTGVISMGNSGVNQELHDLEMDASGNVYISGRLKGTVDFDPSAGTNLLTAKGSDDFFIAKYNSSLQFQWAYRIGSGSAEGDRIDHSISGSELVLSGSFRDTVDLDLKTGTTLLQSNGNYDVFVARYDLSANLQSSFGIGGSGFDHCQSVKILPGDSTFYLTGYFENSVDFDPSASSKNLSASSNQSVFLASYNIDLNYNWASKIAGSGDILTAEINNMGTDAMLFGRIASGTADFNSAWPAPANYNGPASFIARYKECGMFTINSNVADADCGIANGSATLTVQGGNAPYNYAWTSGDTLATADSLKSGSYFVTVTDNNYCSGQAGPITVNDADGPNITVQSKVNVSCFGGRNGAIVINVSGGMAPYNYSWSTGSGNQNINGLKAGFYEITVTDDDDCKSTERIEIVQPSPIVVTPITSEPNCGSTNGVLTAVASGGASPYSYSWSPGGTGGTQFNLGAGIYRVTVSDGNNCTYSQTISLSDDNAPDVTLDNIVDATCGSGGGAINISVSGGTPSYSYSWVPGNFTTQDISSLQAGEYDLIVTDQASTPCKAAFSARVRAKKPDSPKICIVDVDTLTGHAQVIWEKPINQGAIDFYNVYRETTTRNVFDLVEDSIDFGELSLYEDTYADTWVRPWSYKISLTDNCGIESDLSDPHTTIHVVVTKNPQSEFNILWTQYKGDFPVNSYVCWRHTDSTGYDSLATWPASIYTYTDRKSPSKGADVFYFMEIEHPTGCTATEAISKNSSRSNRGSIGPPKFGTSVPEAFMHLSEYRVYPNPNNGDFTLDLTSVFGGIMQVEIYDVQGVKVYQTEKFVNSGRNSITFDIPHLVKGLYLLQLDLNNERSFARVMIDSTD
ncbi:MAG: T9SS type A sorting domain-containing protein [Vicingaceae bacterium]